jgi:AraC-like DNA-binding protein
MQHQEFEPPEQLRDAVKCFWHNIREADEQHSRFEVQPDGYAEIIFYFGATLSMINSQGLQALPSPFMMGLLNQPIVFNAEDRLEIIGVRCYPWTVFDLLGLQPNKDGVRVFEHPIARLQPLLNECISGGNVDGALTLLKDYFVDAQSRIGNSSLLFKAGLAMNKANGIIPVSQVAAAAHVTIRTLERRFKQSAGYSVKDVSGLMRFEQARNRLWQTPDVNLAGLAHELGYTDQSHLSREFKRYSGITPAAFARATRQGKQVMNNDFVTFVQS